MPSCTHHYGTDVWRIVDAITSQSSSDIDVCLLERRRINDAITSQSSEPATTLDLNERNLRPIPIARHVSFASATRCDQVHFDTEFPQH